MSFIDAWVLSSPVAGSRERLQWFLFIRLSVLFAALSSVALMNAITSWPVPATISAYGILSISFLFTLLTSLGLHLLPAGFVVQGMQIAFDAVLTGVWLRWMGTEGGAASLFFIVQILAAAMTFQKRGAWSATVASMASYALVTGSSVGWLSIGTYWVLFWVIGATGGYLAEELARTTEKLLFKQETIEKLTRLQERILTDLPTGLITVDKNLRVNFINPEAAHMLDSPSTAMVGSLLGDVAPELLPFFSTIESVSIEARSLEAESLDENLQVATHGSKNHRSVFVRDKTDQKRLQQRVEGSKRVWRGDVAHLGAAIEGSGLLQSDVTEGRILLFQDVTQVDRLEERLRQNEKLAAVGQLAAGIAHEIRNPLASMSASIEMLMQSAAGQVGEDKRLMEITIREIDRLNGLITEFLEYVRPEQMPMSTVDVAELIEDSASAVRRRPDLPVGAQIVERVDGTLIGLSIPGNPEKLSQVLLNLLINAVQAVEKNGRIEIGARREGARVCIWVHDNGCGMKDSVKPHLFEPFFTTKPKGTGLGLAIAYKIIEVHRGTIDVMSELGIGSRFEIWLSGGAA